MSTSLQPPEGVPLDVWLRIARPLGDRWAINERDADGERVGTAHRFPDGSKGFEKGGKRGLIYAAPLAPYAGTSPVNPIYIAEGASDTAALMALGFDVIGVPAAGLCGPMLALMLIDRHGVFVRDGGKAGGTGTAKLVREAHPRAASLRVIDPPGGAKDARAAIIAGADRAAFEALTRTAPLAAPEAELEPEHLAEGDPLLTCLADVKPEPVSWLWKYRIALGKLTVLAGDPGLGKSFITLDMVSRVSQGMPWPDDRDTPQPVGGAVLLNAEDAMADTIRPRLDAAGADVSRIHALNAIRSSGAKGSECARMFDLARDLPGLEKAIKSVPDCRLVIIDPISAYLGGTDSHKNADVRALLAPLSALAEKYGVAMIAVTHLNKGAGSAIYRATGSLAFVAAARAAWVVGKDKTDPNRRLFVPMKNNIASDTGGLAYAIKAAGENDQPVVTWERDTVSITADELLAASADGRGRTERDDAKEWLSDYLASGSRRATDAETDGKAAGFSMGTLRRAKAELKVRSIKHPFGGPWDWALPALKGAKVSGQDAHAPDGAHLGDSEGVSGGDSPKALTEPGVSPLKAGQAKLIKEPHV